MVFQAFLTHPNFFHQNVDLERVPRKAFNVDLSRGYQTFNFFLKRHFQNLTNPVKQLVGPQYENRWKYRVLETS